MLRFIAEKNSQGCCFWHPGLSTTDSNNSMLQEFMKMMGVTDAAFIEACTLETIKSMMNAFRKSHAKVVSTYRKSLSECKCW